MTQYYKLHTSNFPGKPKEVKENHQIYVIQTRDKRGRKERKKEKETSCIHELFNGCNQLLNSLRKASSTTRFISKVLSGLMNFYMLNVIKTNRENFIEDDMLLLLLWGRERKHCIYTYIQQLTQETKNLLPCK